MAKVILAPFISSISGKVGNLEFRTLKSGKTTSEPDVRMTISPRISSPKRRRRSADASASSRLWSPSSSRSIRASTKRLWTARKSGRKWHIITPSMPIPSPMTPNSGRNCLRCTTNNTLHVVWPRRHFTPHGCSPAEALRSATESDFYATLIGLFTEFQACINFIPPTYSLLMHFLYKSDSF